jgi:hypothetical protein
VSRRRDLSLFVSVADDVGAWFANDEQRADRREISAAALHIARPPSQQVQSLDPASQK